MGQERLARRRKLEGNGRRRYTTISSEQRAEHATPRAELMAMAWKMEAARSGELVVVEQCFRRGKILNAAKPDVDFRRLHGGARCHNSIVTAHMAKAKTVCQVRFQFA